MDMKIEEYIACIAFVLVVAAKPIQAEATSQTTASREGYDIPRVAVKTPDAADWGEGVGFRVEAIADPAIGVAREDFSTARFRLGWNEEGLLVFVEVRDTTPSEGGHLWAGDSVNVMVAHAEDPMDYVTYLISPGRVAGFGEPRISYARWNIDDVSMNPPAPHRFAVRKLESGYVVELLVPWTVFGETSVLGKEFDVQVLVNDHGPGGLQTPRWAQYRIPSGYNKVLKRVRLANEKTSPPVMAAAGCELVNRPPRILSDVAVRVVGDASLAGTTATVDPTLEVVPTTDQSDRSDRSDQRPAPSSAGRVTFVFGEAKDGWSEAFFNVPLPLASEPQLVAMTVVLPSGERVPVPLGNVLAERRERFERLELEFRPWVFAGERFPDVAFKEPTLADALSGFGYKLETRFFDADCKPVEKAERAGRYGAVVDVTAFGETKRKYFMLYRVPDEAALNMKNWFLKFNYMNMRARFDGMPEGLGVDKRVWENDPASVVGGEFKWFLRTQMEENGHLAILLAGLSELPEEVVDGRAPMRPQYRPGARWQEYLFRLKRAVGEDPVYPFLTWKPKDYDKDPERRWPLVVFLHGSGESGTNLNVIKNMGPIAQDWLREDLPFILISPQCFPDSWWEPTAVAALIDKVSETMRVDPDRIYLTGLSMGGFGLCEVVANYPERFAAIAPICGFGSVDDVVLYKDVPIWAFHGTVDELVPVEVTREPIKRLKELGGEGAKNVHYTEYPDGDHRVWNRAYAEREFWKWLLEQRRKN